MATARSRPRPAIVNEAFVRHHYPDGRALGRRFKPGTGTPRSRGRRSSASCATCRTKTASGAARSRWCMCRIARAAGTVPILRRAHRRRPVADRLRGQGRGAPGRFATAAPRRDDLDDVVRQSTSVPRLRGALFATLGLFALALAATGIYGVMAYHVNRGRRDTAIRRALGASGGQVVGTTLVTGLRIVAVGVVLGAVAALATARSLSAMLYRVDPHDPGVIAGATALVAVVAFTACSCRPFERRGSIPRRCCGRKSSQRRG